MSDVITFSRHFPAYHPKKGQETFFVEKIWNSFYGDFRDPKIFIPLEERLYHLNKHLPYEIFQTFRDSILKSRSEKVETFSPKYHTCREGYNWNPGDKFSPRIWSGRPYNSKQIIIGEDIEIKKVWNFELLPHPKPDHDQAVIVLGEDAGYSQLDNLAKNDGLSRIEFLQWMRYPKAFGGQVICWNDKIEY